MARWLNTPGKRKAVPEVLSLVQRAVDAEGRPDWDALRELKELLDSYAWGMFPICVPRALPGEEAQYWASIVSLFTGPRRDVKGPMLDVEAISRKLLAAGPQAPGRLFLYNAADAGSPAESQVLWQIFQLVEKGLQHRLRRCRSCKRWFFGFRVDQVDCSTKCRQAYRHSDEYRAHRAAYMRSRYIPKTPQPQKPQRRTKP